MNLVVHGEVTGGNLQNLVIDLGLTAPNGYVIDGLATSNGSMARVRVTETGKASEAGVFRVRVNGVTGTGGDYTLHISCVDVDGNVKTNTKYVHGVACGSIVPNEIHYSFFDDRYYLTVNKNDRIRINVAVDGGYNDLVLDLGLTAPNGFVIDGRATTNGSMAKTRSLETERLTENGTYVIFVRGVTGTGGSYTLSVGCMLSDGTMVSPGDEPPASAGSSATQTNNQPGDQVTVQFSGVGFPGLSPVDFSDMVELPLMVGVPMTGVISPTGGEILGFKFTANEGDVFDLTYTRASGNLNLGLVVLTENNDVVFQSSLVLSDVVSTHFNIPTTGEYTVGVFKIDLMPPVDPQPTAFQIKVSLNP